MSDRANNIDLVRAALKLAGLQNADQSNGDIFIGAIDSFEELVADLDQPAGTLKEETE
jgi:hypothetical protein